MTKYALNPDGTLTKVAVWDESMRLPPEAPHDDLAVWCPCHSCNERRQMEGIRAAALARSHEIAGRQSRHFTRWLADLRGGVSVQPIGERPPRGGR
jgi:hypothetical protein